MKKSCSDCWFSYAWLFNFWIRPTITTLTVTAYDGTGIVQHQPLTLGCNYTEGGPNLAFDWNHGDVIILSGVVNSQTARFQTGSPWRSGVFLGDFTSSLTIQLPVSSVTPSVAGDYTCRVLSLTGAVHDTATATVQYLDKPNLLVSKTEVVENETVSLTCNVESNPTAELEIKNVDNDTVLVERHTNSLQFTIDKVQCLHNGSFLCTAHNTQIGNASNSAFKEINVKCSPRQDFRHKLDNIVVKQINETAALVAYIIANPVPEFRWFRQESKSLTNISRDTIHSISNSRLQSVLYINISRTQDYGDYVLEIENSQGRSQLLFTLSSKVFSTSNSSDVGVIAGVVTILCLLAVLVIVLFFLYRRGVFNESRWFKSEKCGPLTSNPVPEVQGNAELSLATASPYSNLDHMNSERQTYAELKTYQNNQSIADYEDSSVLPGNKSPTYENTDLKNKDPLYLNVSSSKQTI